MPGEKRKREPDADAATTERAAEPAETAAAVAASASAAAAAAAAAAAPAAGGDSVDVSAAATADTPATAATAAAAAPSPAEKTMSAEEVAAAAAADAELVALHGRRPQFRWYTERLYCQLPEAARVNGGDQITAVHFNGVVLVTLAASHPVVAERKKLIQVDFETGKSAKKGNVSRVDAVKSGNLSGKSKKGGLSMKPETVVADLRTEDGKRYRVHANVEGMLIELNVALMVCTALTSFVHDASPPPPPEPDHPIFHTQTNPDLARLSYSENGWLAIIAPAHWAAPKLRQRIREAGLERDDMMFAED